MGGFKRFLLRGNVVDLAIAIVIGLAFVALVTAFVADFVTPLIAAIGGHHDFSALYFTIHGSVFRYGAFINSVITFLLLWGFLYFRVVLPVGKLIDRYKPAEDLPAPTRDCPHCLSAVPVAAGV